MGVDFITCENPDCNYNFPDCGDFNFCYGCESYFCSDCGELEYDEDNDEQTTCILCRKEKVTDGAMVNYLLKRFGLTYQQALIDYQKEVKPDD